MHCGKLIQYIFKEVTTFRRKIINSNIRKLRRKTFKITRRCNDSDQRVSTYLQRYHPMVLGGLQAVLFILNIQKYKAKTVLIFTSDYFTRIELRVLFNPFRHQSFSVVRATIFLRTEKLLLTSVRGYNNRYCSDVQLIAQILFASI